MDDGKIPRCGEWSWEETELFPLPSKNCTTTDHLNEDHMIYCPSAYLHFLLTSAMLKVADSELLFVDPSRPRHCSFLLISRSPHLAKTPNKAICPDPRSTAIFAQPQCVLACSAEHHMWQDVVMMAAKHSSAIFEHYLCCSPVIWMCVGHRWHQGVEGWRQFVLFPFPHLTLFFFSTLENVDCSHLLWTAGPNEGPGITVVQSGSYPLNFHVQEHTSLEASGQSQTGSVPPTES